MKTIVLIAIALVNMSYATFQTAKAQTITPTSTGTGYPTGKLTIKYELDSSAKQIRYLVDLTAQPCDMTSLTFPVSVDSAGTQWDVILTMTRAKATDAATAAGIVKSFAKGKTAADAIDVMPATGKNVFVIGKGAEVAVAPGAKVADKDATFAIKVYCAVNYGDNAKTAWTPLETKQTDLAGSITLTTHSISGTQCTAADKTPMATKNTFDLSSAKAAATFSWTNSEASTKPTEPAFQTAQLKILTPASDVANYPGKLTIKYELDSSAKQIRYLVELLSQPCDMTSLTFPVSVDTPGTQWDVILTMTRAKATDAATVAGIVKSFAKGKTAKDAVDVMPATGKNVFVIGKGAEVAVAAAAAKADNTAVFAIKVYCAVNYGDAKTAWTPLETKQTDLVGSVTFTTHSISGTTCKATDKTPMATKNTFDLSSAKATKTFTWANSEASTKPTEASSGSSSSSSGSSSSSSSSSSSNSSNSTATKSGSITKMVAAVFMIMAVFNF